MLPLIGAQLDMLEQRIGDQAFVSGAQPSIADCSLFALIHSWRARLLPLAADHPRIDAWFGRFLPSDRVRARDLPRTSLNPRLP